MNVPINLLNLIFHFPTLRYPCVTLHLFRSKLCRRYHIHVEYSLPIFWIKNWIGPSSKIHSFISEIAFIHIMLKLKWTFNTFLNIRGFTNCSISLHTFYESYYTVSFLCILLSFRRVCNSQVPKITLFNNTITIHDIWYFETVKVAWRSTSGSKRTAKIVKKNVL